ncbi:MAG: hypothetical protein ISS47_09560 [Candidatus Omnitrophica bacterium]|nr:hypothetical protein [Candidatus Omnitrophota bacterium]
MKKMSNILLGLGVLLVIYSIFSRFYGEPSVAMRCFRSLSFLIFANTVLILSVIAKGNSK